jgi:YVTN family beta-propeller protein
MRLANYFLAVSGFAVAASAHAAQDYRIFVSNERSGDVTVINGSDNQVLGTIMVGKRPRGIHASPDGKTIYVAVSGTPLAAPPKLDAKGNPIFVREKADDDDDEAKSDKSADAIMVIDATQLKVIGKINGGSDPEEFALSKDGKKIYVSNEDVKAASVIDIATNKVEHIVAVAQEPEGVAVTPDGKQFYITCESGGDIYIVDVASYKVVGQFKVQPRPRNVAFLTGAAVGFIPSESAGILNVIDTAQYKVTKTVTMPEGSRPMAAKLSPDGKLLYVSNGRGGSISVLDTHNYAVLDTIKVGVRPWGIVLSPDGKFLYTANGTSNDVSVVDLKAGKEVAKIRAGMSPWGVAVAASP